MDLSDKLSQLDDDAIFIPKCEFEQEVTDCFNISLSRSVNGFYADYVVVKDFAQSIEEDPIELYRWVRMMASEING